jgi:hypothetical protein
MDYAIAMKSDNGFLSEVVNPQPGFCVGVIGEYRFNEYLALRLTPGVTFGGRYIQYVHDTTKLEASSTSVIFEMPVLVKLSAKRYGNTRGYILAGASAKYDINSERNLNPDSGVFIKNKSWDICLEFGVGFDWYMEFFKLSTELRFSLGLLDIINHNITEKEIIKYSDYTIENYTNNIDRMSSKVVSLLFHFE